ncbi:MAG TPA: V-type ATP synthase subunit D [archaeon]|nr:V-type ATP synthase subunit D [archaeon]
MEVKATRSELINLKQKVKLARGGKDILKRKLDALVVELMNMLDKVREVRSEFNVAYEKANKAVGIAIAYDGLAALKSISAVSGMKIDVDLKPKNIMGVKVPEVNYSLEERGQVASPFTTSLRVYRVKHAYEDVVKKAMDLVEVEIGVKRLLKEVESTKRRVNALDYKIIPEMEGAIQFIRLHLDELEREDFVRLKQVAAG